MARRSSKRRSIARERGYPPIEIVPAAQETPRPVRGVRLKVVSTFTMLFALLCLAALLAGRTEMPVEASTDANYEAVVCSGCLAEATAQPSELRNNDSGRVGFNSGPAEIISSHREPPSKERNKRARSRAAVRFGFVHPQQEDE